jgi:protoporphyrinogen oxidase
MTYDLLIIGAGISGLSLAHLGHRQGLKVLVLDAALRVGGCIATHNFSELNEFWVEAGAHTCFNSYGNLINILNDVGLTSHIKPKARVNFKILRHDKLKSVLTALRPLELVWYLPRLSRETKVGRSVKEYYSRILGEKNYRDLFGPAFNAVICQPADEFPAELLFRPKPRRKGLPRSFIFSQGLSTISNAIATQIGIKVVTNANVVTVEINSDGEMQAITADGQAYIAKNLALAVPPDKAAGILSRTFGDLAGFLANIRMAEIASISLAVANKTLKLSPLAGIIAPYEPFYSAVTRDYLKDSQYRGFTFHFPKDQLDTIRQLERIREILKIPKTEAIPIAYTQHRLPALRANHIDWIAKIDKALAKTNLMLTGNYFLGVSMEDCVTRSVHEWQRVMDNGAKTLRRHS